MLDQFIFGVIGRLGIVFRLDHSPLIKIADLSIVVWFIWIFEAHPVWLLHFLIIRHLKLICYTNHIYDWLLDVNPVDFNLSFLANVSLLHNYILDFR